MGRLINRRKYYLKLCRERTKLLYKLEGMIGRLYCMNPTNRHLPRLARIASKVEASARYYELLAQSEGL